MSVAGPSLRLMLIDCDACVMRDLACADCAVSFLLTPQRLSAEESTAVAVLAGSGLVPPLRMVHAGGEGAAGERTGLRTVSTRDRCPPASGTPRWPVQRKDAEAG